MRAELKAIGAVHGTTTLYVTHDSVEALALGDRIGVIRDGRIVQTGTREELWHRPHDTFVARSFGRPRINLLPGTAGDDGTFRLLEGDCERAPRVDAAPGTPVQPGWQRHGPVPAGPDRPSGGHPAAAPPQPRVTSVCTASPTRARDADWIGPDKSSVVAPSTLLADAHAAGLRVGAYTFRAENQFLPAELRRGTDPNGFGDAFAEYALHYGLGVDAVVTDFPDLAVAAREEFTAGPGTRH